MTEEQTINDTVLPSGKTLLATAKRSAGPASRLSFAD